ncbi:MAG: RrF2 family transcriptional regulator [Acidobacteriota bacterium]
MNSTEAYRLEALLELAAAYPRPLTATSVARRRGVPEAFLARLLAGLSRAGVVAAVRGPGGGVRLARPPETIELATLLPSSRPSEVGGPAVRWLVASLAEGRARVLRSLTLASLLRVEREQAMHPDFVI